MTNTCDVCIRGAGIVGRTLALQLASKRLRVALVEQPSDNAAARADPGADARADVRAYALSPASRALLEAVRCWPDEAHATPVLHMQVHSANPSSGESSDGATASVHFDAGQENTAALNWIVDVPVLQDLLTQAVRFQPLIEVCTEAPASASLTVVTEGRTSSTRESLGVEFDLTPYHQSAVAARVQCEHPHGQTARQWFAAGEVLALLPMGGADGSLCALVWSVDTERARALLALDEAAFCQALQDASGNALGPITLASDRQSWPLQAALAQRWSGSTLQKGHYTSWVLAGDAAHSVHPLAGQGLNLGLGDVAELVKVLDERPYWRNVADPKLLRSYERARKAEYALVGGSGDALQQLFAHPNPTLATLRDWGMRAFDNSSALKHWAAKRAMGVGTGSQ